MQFPVPQFTDVEDKIIGPLSVKQFMILFGAGVVVFLAFSLTKSLIVTIFFGILVGLPALGVAFVKVNGRPIYNTFGFILQFITSPKILIFHKEVYGAGSSAKLKNADLTGIAPAPALSHEDTQSRLKEINTLLQKKAEEEKELLKHMG